MFNLETIDGNQAVMLSVSETLLHVFFNVYSGYFTVLSQSKGIKLLYTF